MTTPALVGTILSVVGSLLAGLSAGVFLAFSAGVQSGLDRAARRSGPRTYVEAMRGINRAVINPAFLAPIFLAPPVLLVAGGLAIGAGRSAPGALLLAAGAVGLLGTVVVTVARNIPLNNRLETSSDADADVRAFFHRPWLRANHLRTVSATLALLLAILALAAD